MFALPSLKARLANRKRGVSIENVMLGLIIVLIFAGMLYGAFTVVQRYVAKNTALRVMPMASSEARILYRNQADFTGLDTAQLIQAGAIPMDSISSDGTDETFVLPFGGDVVFTANAADATTFDAVVTWESNTRNAIALCTSLAAGESGVIISGPMGSEYSLNAATDCSAAQPTVSVTYERG